VLVPGFASTLDVDRLRAAADQSATFRSTLARHGLAVYAQIQQTAGCNASHTVESASRDVCCTRTIYRAAASLS